MPNGIDLRSRFPGGRLQARDHGVVLDVQRPQISVLDNGRSGEDGAR